MSVVWVPDTHVTPGRCVLQTKHVASIVHESCTAAAGDWLLLIPCASTYVCWAPSTHSNTGQGEGGCANTGC